MMQEHRFPVMDAVIVGPLIQRARQFQSLDLHIKYVHRFLLHYCRLRCPELAYAMSSLSTNILMCLDCSERVGSVSKQKL